MIRLFALPHHEARAILSETDAPVFLTANPVEFHGPHLPLWTDHLISTGLNAAVHGALSASHPDWPYLVADELAGGVEPAAGPGSRLSSFAGLRARVVEACRALTELGARRVVINTFHGHPMHNLALEAGVNTVWRAGGRAVALLPIALREMIDLDVEAYRDVFESVDAPEAVREALARELRTDFHAGFFETSLVMHFAPDSVSPRHTELPPCPAYPRHHGLARLGRVMRRLGAAGAAQELDFLSEAVHWTSLRPFVGYTGQPAYASAEVGAAFAEHLVARYVAAVEDALVQGHRPPPPPMRWMAPLTLNGRLPEPRPPVTETRAGFPGDRG